MELFLAICKDIKKLTWKKFFQGLSAALVCFLIYFYFSFSEQNSNRLEEINLTENEPTPKILKKNYDIEIPRAVILRNPFSPEHESYFSQKNETVSEFPKQAIRHERGDIKLIGIITSGGRSSCLFEEKQGNSNKTKQWSLALNEERDGMKLIRVTNSSATLDFHNHQETFYFQELN